MIEQWEPKKSEFERQEIRTGEIVVITEGEYSSYRIWYVAKALKDFTMPEVRFSVPRHPPNKLGHQGRVKYGYLEWLVVGGFVEEIEYHEIWGH